MELLNILNALQRTYRIFDRYGLGGSIKYSNKSEIFEQNNIFTVGG